MNARKSWAVQTYMPQSAESTMSPSPKSDARSQMIYDSTPLALKLDGKMSDLKEVLELSSASI